MAFWNWALDFARLRVMRAGLLPVRNRSFGMA
jgi:hypothetical protein